MSKINLIAIASLVFTSTAMPAMAREIKPIDLTFQGYQGYFIEQGIPSSGTFIQKVRLGQIDAETLVKGAIDKQRIAPETISDRDYLKRVEAALFKIQRRK